MKIHAINRDYVFILPHALLGPPHHHYWHHSVLSLEEEEEQRQETVNDTTKSYGKKINMAFRCSSGFALLKEYRNEDIIVHFSQ